MKILPATAHDVAALARLMRPSDRYEIREVARATGRLPADWNIEAHLMACFSAGECWAMWRGEELVAIGGATPTDTPGVGAIWLLGTDAADRHVLAMTRACRRFLRMAHRQFTLLGNVVPCHMILRLRWLKHLGFDTSGEKAQLPLQGHVTFWSHRP